VLSFCRVIKPLVGQHALWHCDTVSAIGTVKVTGAIYEMKIRATTTPTYIDEGDTASTRRATALSIYKIFHDGSASPGCAKRSTLGLHTHTHTSDRILLLIFSRVCKSSLMVYIVCFGSRIHIRGPKKRMIISNQRDTSWQDRMTTE